MDGFLELPKKKKNKEGQRIILHRWRFFFFCIWCVYINKLLKPWRKKTFLFKIAKIIFLSEVYLSSFPFRIIKYVQKIGKLMSSKGLLILMNESQAKAL